MKKLKILNKILPENVVVKKQEKYFINGFQLDVEQLDHYAAEAEMFRKTLLYKFWQNEIRTSVIEDIIKNSKDYSDVERGRSLLYALDRLENMMLDLIKQQSKIVKK